MCYFRVSKWYFDKFANEFARHRFSSLCRKNGTFKEFIRRSLGTHGTSIGPIVEHPPPHFLFMRLAKVLLPEGRNTGTF